MITFLLHSAFLIDNQILIDPHDGGSIGLPRPEVKAPLILITHNHYDHNAYEIIPHETVKMRMYSTLSYNNYTIEGIKAYHDKEKGKRRGEVAIYKITTPKGLVIVHLADLGHLPDENLVEKLSNPDVLMIPVGGVITIDAKEAVSVINSLKPKIVIPMHYWVKGHYMPLDPPDYFLELIKKERKIVEVNQKDIDVETISPNSVVFFRV